jgi:hypothetical protein
MQMTKQGATKSVPDELVRFMAARGWEPVGAAEQPAPETPSEDPGEFIVWDAPEDEDVVDPDDVTDSDTDPAEEQS